MLDKNSICDKIFGSNFEAPLERYNKAIRVEKWS